MNGNFFDSNVLLYTVDHDARKATITRELVADGGTISVQVLNEISHVGRRKFGLDWDEIDDVLDAFRNLLTVTDLTLAIHRKGLVVARRYQISVYDGMIVSAALHAGCDTLWSEDMHDGLVVERQLTIRNPFA